MFCDPIKGANLVQKASLAPEVADFIDARMEHVTLAQEARGIPQKSTLLFARKLCGIFGPGDEFQMLVVVA